MRQLKSIHNSLEEDDPKRDDYYGMVDAAMKFIAYANYAEMCPITLQLLSELSEKVTLPSDIYNNNKRLKLYGCVFLCLYEFVVVLINFCFCRAAQVEATRSSD